MTKFRIVSMNIIDNRLVTYYAFYNSMYSTGKFHETAFFHPNYRIAFCQCLLN
jgi:hypothetical protein